MGDLKLIGKMTLKKSKKNLPFNQLINAGIYLCKPNVVDLVPKNKFYNMTDLIDKALNQNLKCKVYLIEEFWIDIGNLNDYKSMQERIKFYDL